MACIWGCEKTIQLVDISYSTPPLFENLTNNWIANSPARKKCPPTIARTSGPSTHSNNRSWSFSLSESTSLTTTSPSSSSWWLRTGLKPPRKSDPSLYWWQLMVINWQLFCVDRYWQTLVLPQPVSPTSSTGSTKRRALPTRTASLRSE